MRHLISFTKPCSNFSHCHKFLNCFSYQVFVGARLHVSGGVLRGGRVIDAEASVAVLDTAAGVWLDRNGQVTSARGSKGQIDQDPSFELMRRCRHGAASVGIRIYVHGGLRGDVLLDDFLVAENSTFQSDISSPLLASDRTQQSSTPRFSYAARPPSGSEPSFSMSEGLSLDENSLEKLTEASAAEAEVASSVWRAAQLGAGTLDEEPSTSDASSPIVESTTDGTANEGDVRLHPRAVC
jgi:protein phosphatase